MTTRLLLVSLIILAAGVCLALGVTQPVIKLTKLYVWTDEHSMASVIWALYRDGEYSLSLVILVFSILLPGLKLVYLLAAALATVSRLPDLARIVRQLEWIGRWSMLDVLVLALTIFYVKSSGIADGVTLPGFYFFVASVFLTMIANSLLPLLAGARRD